ncbi:hypothetical protein J6590_055009 [Homalodisca vitripennis]|nr:hypothetical protein J6590_055009 [Homalodisca vitripennis]
MNFGRINNRIQRCILDSDWLRSPTQTTMDESPGPTIRHGISALTPPPPLPLTSGLVGFQTTE